MSRLLDLASHDRGPIRLKRMTQMASKVEPSDGYNLRSTGLLDYLIVILLQLRELVLGFLQDGDVGVCVFP